MAGNRTPSRPPSVYVRVKVAAGAKREAVVLKGGVFYVSVREKAELNRANARVVALLARELKVSERAVRIVRGRRGPSKTLAVTARNNP